MLRFLLGSAEASFFPGIVLFLTYWYPARERARVMAMFYLGIPLANVIGAPISSSLVNLNGFGGLHGWQWLFIIEGLPAVGLVFSAVGVMCAQPTFWTMPSAILTDTAAAGGIAIINSIGNLGGFVGPYVVGWVADTTKNPATGLIVLTCTVLISAGAVLALQPETVGERSRKSSAAR